MKNSNYKILIKKYSYYKKNIINICIVFFSFFIFSLSTHGQDNAKWIKEQTNGKCETLSCYNEYEIMRITNGKCKTLSCYNEYQLMELTDGECKTYECYNKRLYKETTDGRCETAACYLKELQEDTKKYIISETKGVCNSKDYYELISCYCKVFPCASAKYYDYEVEGYSYNHGYVRGEITADSDGDVEGLIFLDDGREISFEGEFVGKGEIEGYDADGSYYELEVD